MKRFAFLFFLLYTALVYSQHETGSTFHHDPAHTGIYSSINPGGFGDLQWEYKTGGKIFGSPAIFHGVAFIGSEDKNLYAINIINKKLIWKFSTGGAVHSSPAVFKNTVYFSSYDGYYYALDAGSSKLRWKFKTSGEKKVGAKGLWTMKPIDEYMEDPFDFFISSPVIDEKNSIMYCGSGDGSLYALNTNNGALIWKFGTNGIIHASPALYNGTVYIGSWDKYFYAIDAKTGKEKWKFKTREDSAYHLLEGIQSSATVYDGMVYFGSRDGYFYALDAETGKELWKYSANNSWILTTAAVKDHTIYIGTSDTYQFLALDAKTGKEKYHVQANGYIYSSPAIAGNTAYFGDFTGQLIAVDINANGKILDRYETGSRKSNARKILNKNKIDFAYLVNGLDLSFYSATIVGMNKLYSLGPILSSPAISNGTIYFGSADGCLYALKLK